MWRSRIAPRTSSNRAASGSARWRWRTRSWGIQPWPRPRSSRCLTPSGANGRWRSWCSRRGTRQRPRICSPTSRGTSRAGGSPTGSNSSRRSRARRSASSASRRCASASGLVGRRKAEGGSRRIVGVWRLAFGLSPGGWPNAERVERTAVATMREAVIVEAVRTPVGRRNGCLKDWHPVDLLAHTLGALVDRAGIDPGVVEDVIAGCVSQVGEQSLNVGRNAALAAGFPETVPGTTIDRQCGSSQQAVHFAAQGIVSGAYDVAIACGVEPMTRVPMGSSYAQGPGAPFGSQMLRRYDNGLVHQGISADLVAQKWELSRAELDEFS